MASSSVALRAEPIRFPQKLFALLPGVALLAIVGMAGKVLEKSQQ